MANGKYRGRLPHLEEDSGLFLTDGGSGAVFIFLMDIELKDFATFPLLYTETGRKTLLDYQVVRLKALL